MSVASLHGELTKVQRQSTLQKFRRGALRCTALADLPPDPSPHVFWLLAGCPALFAALGATLEARCGMGYHSVPLAEDAPPCRSPCASTRVCAAPPLVHARAKPPLRQPSWSDVATRGLDIPLLPSTHLTTLSSPSLPAGDYQALIVSDVAARGLDIPDCDAVFHLELPTDAAHYAHRAGRTGRAGRPGTVVSLVAGGERHVIDKLQRRLGVNISEVQVRGGEAAERPQRRAAPEGGAPSGSATASRGGSSAGGDGE